MTYKRSRSGVCDIVRWKIRPGDIVTHTFPITQVKEAFELSDAGKARKVVFVWD